MTRRPFRHTLALALFVLWLFAVLAAFYVAHKPFQAPTLLALGRTLAGVGGAGLVVALGGGIGLAFLGKLDLAPIEQLVLSAALGLGAVSLAALGLGAAGLLTPWLLWTLTLVGLAATARPLWRALRDARIDRTWRPHSRFQTILAAYCGLMLIIGLIWALTPPTAWDGLVYHLTAPRLYLAAGHISHPIDLPYLGFPQLSEMLFTWGMGMAGERAAAPIHWFYGLLTVLALVTAGRRWFDAASGWLAAAVLLSARTVVFLLGWPYVDLALLLYTTLAFFALIRWIDGRSARWLILSGILAGFALSTKYTALALLPALSLVLLVLQTRSGRPAVSDLPSTIRHSLVLCAVALLVWSPWLVKNLLFTGNPIYPFFFDGIHWDGWRSWWYDRPGTGFAYTAPHRLLTAPWDATVWGVEGGAGYSATVGPLYLALLPLLFLVWKRLRPRDQQWLRAAAVLCGVLYAFWLWGVARTALLRQTRLLLPAFGVLALMAGGAVEGLRVLPTRRLDLGWIVRVVIALVLALTLVGTLLFTVRQQPLQVLLGFESREDFLTRRLGWYYATVKQLNDGLPADSVILFLWEPRSYHCQLDCRPDALLDRWVHTTHIHGHDSDAVASAWRADGVTHVLLHRAGLDHILEAEFDPVTPADLQALDDLTTEHMSLVDSFGSAYELYRLRGQ
ncbi:MAG: glycosyltransferase family 39 protein [Chloroflexota bacterium]|nr:glycosyltransferase family 39 protein [Chloroflexota bacterium]